MKNPELIKLYQNMYEHTRPKCDTCRVPLSCCDKFYCELAKNFAKEVYQIELKPTSHKTNLLFMSETGCIVPPYLRPLCTLHNCKINSLSFDPNDPKWTEKYFKIRNQIEKIEY